MQISLVKKGIVFAVILLFMGTSVVSSAVDGNRDVDDEARENPEFKPLNNDREIITFIRGAVCDCSTGKGFIIRHAQMSTCNDQCNLHIWGFKYSTNGKIVRYGAYPKEVIAPRFIGYCIQVHPAYSSIHGIALGDIEWS